MATKRKLPVLNRPGGEGDEPPRPQWQWVFFGAVLVFAAWLPLAWLAEALKRRISAGLLGDVTTAADTERAMNALAGGARAALVTATIGLPLAAMAGGAAAAGYVVGRYGAPVATARTATAAGLAAAGFASVLLWATSGFSLVPLAAFAVLGGAAWWGGARGVAARARG